MDTINLSPTEPIDTENPETFRLFRGFLYRGGEEDHF